MAREKGEMAYSNEIGTEIDELLSVKHREQQSATYISVIIESIPPLSASEAMMEYSSNSVVEYAPSSTVWFQPHENKVREQKVIGALAPMASGAFQYLAVDLKLCYRSTLCAHSRDALGALQ